MDSLDIGFDSIMECHPDGCYYKEMMQQEDIIEMAECCRGLVTALEQEEDLEEWITNNCPKCNNYYGSDILGDEFYHEED